MITRLAAVVCAGVLNAYTALLSGSGQPRSWSMILMMILKQPPYHHNSGVLVRQTLQEQAKAAVERAIRRGEDSEDICMWGVGLNCCSQRGGVFVEGPVLQCEP